MGENLKLDPIERMREELTRTPLFSERNGYAPLDRKPFLDLLGEIEAQYMRLPEDSGGVPIRPGQTLYDGEKRIPGDYVYAVDYKRVYIWNYDGTSRITGVYADSLSHNKPEPEPRPCPFCGSSILYEVYHTIDGEEMPAMFCNFCKAIVTFEGYEDYIGDGDKDGMLEIRRAWNNRPETGSIIDG